MFCPNCGKEIKESKFCSYCGSKIVSKEDSKEHVNDTSKTAQEKPFNNAMIGVVIGVAALIVVLIIIFSSRNSMITDEQFESLMRSVATTRVGSIDSYFNVKEVNIISKERDKENDLVKVICDVTMSNGVVTAEVQCNVFCKEQEDRWSIITHNIAKVYDIKPLQGATEPTDILESTIQGFYPDINWGYYQENFLSKDINYNFPIYWNLTERNTDLENKKDQMVYDYSFDTNTVHVSGNVVFDYEFTEDGIWTTTAISQNNNEIEWNIEGLWSFDIYTYYIDVNIVDIDFDTHMATIQRRGSAFQGSGSAENIEIGFVEDGNCIYFDTFVIPKDGMWGKDHEVTLMAKLDDLYYKSPSLISGGEGYDVGIGGKSN